MKSLFLKYKDEILFFLFKLILWLKFEVRVLSNTFNGEKMTINSCKSSKNSNKKTFSFTKTRSRNKNLSELKPISSSYINSPKSGIYSPKEIRLKLENKKFQNFKKYAVNKIIRNYNYYSPRDYFIFDINEKK